MESQSCGATLLMVPGGNTVMLDYVETVIRVGLIMACLYPEILYAVDCGVRNIDCAETYASLYSGFANTTVLGYHCKDNTYCRGVGTWKPWCYTSSKDKWWDYCPIRECEECDKSKLGFSR